MGRRLCSTAFLGARHVGLPDQVVERLRTVFSGVNLDSSRPNLIRAFVPKNTIRNGRVKGP